MKVMIFIGLIIFAIAIAKIVQERFFRKVSVNYIVLIIGMAIALIPQTDLLIENFNSEVFLGLIVAPLLFFEGQRTRLYSILRSWRAIIGLTSSDDYISYSCSSFWCIFFRSRNFNAFSLYFSICFYANRCYCY